MMMMIITTKITIIITTPLRPTITTIIIITLKGAIPDFYYLLTAPQTVSNSYAEVAQAQSCAIHQAFITCSML